MTISTWVSTRGVNTIRIAGHFLDSAESPTAQIEEAQLDTSSSPRVIRNHTLTVTNGPDRFYQEIDLTARVFRLIFSNMGDARNVAVTVRKVN